MDLGAIPTLLLPKVIVRPGPWANAGVHAASAESLATIGGIGCCRSGPVLGLFSPSHFHNFASKFVKELLEDLGFDLVYRRWAPSENIFAPLARVHLDHNSTK